jgi:hypothetical protein
LRIKFNGGKIRGYCFSAQNNVFDTPYDGSVPQMAISKPNALSFNAGTILYCKISVVIFYMKKVKYPQQV